MIWGTIVESGIKKPTGFFLVWIFPVYLFSNTVFVSTGGNDSNPGTMEEPFSTISFAVSVISPGDTVYVLSGRFILTSAIQISSAFSGSPGNVCHLFAYPDDTVMLDFYLQPFGNRGVSLRADYWYLKGLIVCNAGDNGLYIDGAYNRIEQCIFYGNDDSGLQISGGGSHNIVINCDAYNNVDPDHEDADGFAAKLDIGPGNEFHGCRAWNNSDDGWDLFEADDSVVIADCWAFRNGYLPNESASGGDGNGFKLGGNHLPGNHLVKNCIAFGNRKYGYHQNNNTGEITVYNSAGWENAGRNYNFYYDTAGPNTLTNNVSFNGGSSDRFTNCDQLTNSWQKISAGPEDFQSLDSEIAKDARLPDGTLPPNTFSKLNVGSNLIDSGTDVGIAYTGSAPDLGPFETFSSEAEFTLGVSTSGKGGVWLSPPGGIYETDQEVTLTAWNSENYLFDAWSGDLSGSDVTTNLTMDSDKAVTANFLPLTDIYPDSFRIEAEDMILSDFIFERIAYASNGKVVKPVSTSFGNALAAFSGEESYYRIVVRYFDNVNGAATYQFSVNNELIDTWEGDASTTTSFFTDKTIINVTLAEEDIMKIESKPGGQEYGRVDCIDVVKSDYIETDLILTEDVKTPATTITAYPNPFFSHLYIKLNLEKPSTVKVEILSADSRLIAIITDNSFSEGSYLFEYSGKYLSSGLYLVRLVTDDGIRMIPLIRK